MTQDQKSTDIPACKYEASESTAGNPKAPTNIRGALKDGVARGMKETDLIKQCMHLRGYH